MWQLSKSKMDAAGLHMQVGFPQQITQSRNKRTLANEDNEQQKWRKSWQSTLAHASCFQNPVQVTKDVIRSTCVLCKFRIPKVSSRNKHIKLFQINLSQIFLSLVTIFYRDASTFEPEIAPPHLPPK